MDAADSPRGSPILVGHQRPRVLVLEDEHLRPPHQACGAVRSQVLAPFRRPNGNYPFTFSRLGVVPTLSRRGTMVALQETRGSGRMSKGPLSDRRDSVGRRKMREIRWREACPCGATCTSGPLWGCRFCARPCCPHCTYAPEGLAVCFRCAEDMFAVYVPWLSFGVGDRAVPRRSTRTTDTVHAARYAPRIPSGHG